MNTNQLQALYVLFLVLYLLFQFSCANGPEAEITQKVSHPELFSGAPDESVLRVTTTIHFYHNDELIESSIASIDDCEMPCENIQNVKKMARRKVDAIIKEWEGGN